MKQGISLHIGLNSVDPAHYAGWSGPLVACEADAKDMQALAKKAHFTSSILLTKNATRQNVLDAISDAAGKLKSGDIFLLTTSSHGGQVTDTNHDDDDGQDETWCMYDAQIIDDELYYAWSKFEAGVRIIVLSDSCHSGTILKDAFFHGADLPVTRPRKMPADVAMKTFIDNEEFYTGIQKNTPKVPEAEVKASVLLLSGCQDNQTSSDGERNGLFTAALLAVWRNGAYKGTYKSFRKKIMSFMPPVQSPNYYVVGTPDAAFEKQKPFTI